LYGREACPLNSAVKRSFEIDLRVALEKLFHTTNEEIINENGAMFDLKSINELITVIEDTLFVYTCNKKGVCILFPIEYDDMKNIS
jgi:capsid portal protein